MHAPNLTHYKGFDIDRRYNIFKGGKPIFTARWQKCFSLDEAKQLIDASVAARMLPSLGSYSPMMLLEHEEQRERDWQDFEVKLEQHYLIEHENLNEQL